MLLLPIKKAGTSKHNKLGVAEWGKNGVHIRSVVMFLIAFDFWYDFQISLSPVSLNLSAT